MSLIQLGLIILSGFPILATIALGYQLLRNGQGAMGKPTIHPLVFYPAKLSIGFIIWLLFWISIIPSDLNQIPWLIQTEIPEVQKLLSLIFLFGANLLLIPAYYTMSIFTRVGLPKGKHALQTQGIYRLSRNPMYASFLFFNVSCFLLAPSLLLAALMLFNLVVHHFIIVKEEQFLNDTFSSEYKNYKESTARYL